FALALGSSCRATTSESPPEELLEWLEELDAIDVGDGESSNAPVDTIDLSYEDVTDTDLARLKCFTQLQWLNLRGTKISDAGLAHLRAFPRLEVLVLSGTKITDKGLEHLSEAPQLEFLYLDDTLI